MSKLFDLCDSVAAKLSAMPELSVATVERAIIPPYDVGRIGTGLKVYVLAQSMNSDDGSTRDEVKVSPNVFVVFMEKLNASTIDNRTIEIVGIIENVLKYLKQLDQLDEAGSYVSSIEYSPIYDADLLNSKSVFQGVLGLNCQTYL